MGTGKYLVRSVIVLLVAGLGGCLHVPVTMESLEWHPAVLSKEGCPDLTGVYRDQAALHEVFSDGLTKGIDGGQPIAQVVTVKSWLPQGRLSIEAYREAYRVFSGRAILSIEHQGSILKATLMDRAGDVYKKITLNLGTSQTGCHAGALVIRRKSVNRRAEWGGGDVTWGEQEVRKLDDGSLQVTSRERIQALSILTGAPTGPVRVMPENVAVYPPVPPR